MNFLKTFDLKKFYEKIPQNFLLDCPKGNRKQNMSNPLHSKDQQPLGKVDSVKDTYLREVDSEVLKGYIRHMEDHDLEEITISLKDFGEMITGSFENEDYSKDSFTFWFEDIHTELMCRAIKNP